MIRMILAVLIWLHLTATMIWIGGIAFVLFIALPSAKELLGSEAGKIMGIISNRFAVYVNYCIVLLIVTGISIVVIRWGFSNTWSSDSSLLTVIMVKMVIFLMMVAIHFYRGLVLPRIIKNTQPSEILRLQKLSLNLVKTNLVLGLGVLFFSSFMAVV